MDSTCQEHTKKKQFKTNQDHQKKKAQKHRTKKRNKTQLQNERENMSIHLESQTFFKKNKKTQRLCLLSIYPSVFVGATLSKNDCKHPLQQWARVGGRRHQQGGLHKKKQLLQTNKTLKILGSSGSNHDSGKPHRTLF